MILIYKKPKSFECLWLLIARVPISTTVRKILYVFGMSEILQVRGFFTVQSKRLKKTVSSRILMRGIFATISRAEEMQKEDSARWV